MRPNITNIPAGPCAGRQLPVRRHPRGTFPPNKPNRPILLIDKHILRRHIAMDETKIIPLLSDNSRQCTYVRVMGIGHGATRLFMEAVLGPIWANGVLGIDPVRGERTTEVSAYGAAVWGAEILELVEPVSEGIGDGGDVVRRESIERCAGQRCAWDA